MVVPRLCLGIIRRVASKHRGAPAKFQPASTAHRAVLFGAVLFGGGLLSVLASPAFADEAPQDKELDRLIAKVEHGKAAEIIKAADVLRRRDADVLRAADALATACRNEQRDVRNAAVLALGDLCYRHDRQCHLMVVRLMFDADSTVRTNAGGYVGLMAERLPKEATSILLARAAHRNDSIRTDVLLALAKCELGNPVIDAVIRQATHDKNYLIRSNAIVALQQRTNDLKSTVPLWLMLLDSPKANNEKRSKGSQHIAKIVAAQKLREMGNESPSKMASVLLALLGDESSVVRGAAARIVGAIAEENEKAREALLAGDAQTTLKNLLQDEDKSVRANAAIGLKRLTP